MDPSSRLARNLLSESRAYGYTLSVWGGGALLIAEFGSPTALDVFVFVGAALGAFAVLAGVAFGQFTVEPGERKSTVTSLVHIVATVGNLLVAYGLTVAVGGHVAFALVGFQTSLGYNLALLLEERAAKVAA